jgi:[ribosomal protein S5]-alanine N-acetyltransferase
LVNTEGWLKFIGDKNILTVTDAAAYIRKINDNLNVSYRTVKLKDHNCPIVLVTLIKRDYLACKDIGFAMLPDFYNKGYAYEAVSAVLSLLVKQKVSTTIPAEALPENSGLIKLIEKLGLRFNKTIKTGNETLLIYEAAVGELSLCHPEKNVYK